jgi:hypothetical protein
LVEGNCDLLVLLEEPQVLLIVLLDLEGRDEHGLRDVPLAHVLDDGVVLDLVAELGHRFAALVERLDEDHAVAAVTLADFVIDALVDERVGDDAAGLLEVLDDELAVNERLKHVELRLLEPVEELLALQILAQQLFGLGDLLVDLQVGDDLVVDHRGDAVGEQLAARGSGAERERARPEDERYDNAELVKPPDAGNFCKEATHEMISPSLEIGSGAVKRGNFPLTMM